MQSLKDIGQNDLEVIINSPDKLLLAERRILEKELEEIKKPSLQPKELFPSPYTGSPQVVSTINSPVLVSTIRQTQLQAYQRACKWNHESTKPG